MNATIHDTLHIITTVVSCICILGVIALVNYTFSRDKVITRTLKHQ
jgi:hypothetical protein